VYFSQSHKIRRN